MGPALHPRILNHRAERDAPHSCDQRVAEPAPNGTSAIAALYPPSPGNVGPTAHGPL